MVCKPSTVKALIYRAANDRVWTVYQHLSVSKHCQSFHFRLLSDEILWLPIQSYSVITCRTQVTIYIILRHVCMMYIC